MRFTASSIRRVVLCGLIYLVCGLAINVMVATACSLWAPPSDEMTALPWGLNSRAAEIWGDRKPLFDDEVGCYAAFVWRTTLRTQIRVSAIASFSFTEADATYDESVRAAVDVVSITEVGWPARSLAGAVRSYKQRLIYEDAIPRPSWLWAPSSVRGSAVSCIPLRPMLVGTAVNALFYGSIVCALHATWHMLRRRSRRRRGCCPNCGYDLRGSREQGCAECGWER